MSDSSKRIIEIQNNYFAQIQELFGDLILIFEKEATSVSDAVDKYLSKQKTFFIPGYKDNLAYKRQLLYKNNYMFWSENKNLIADYIKSRSNVGIFGVGDNTFIYDYPNEIKRNSLFYDILVFNDPFYTYYSSDKELNFNSNAVLFYESILYLWIIKRYTSLDGNEAFSIVFPFDSLLSDEEKNIIADNSKNHADSWVNEMFGIKETINGTDNLVNNISLLKDMTLEEIQEKLYKNGIYQSVTEALNYSQNLLSDAEKREIERFCIESWGSFNRDFVRCLLLMEALPSIALTNYYTYKLHTIISAQLNSSPIIAQREWGALQRDLKNHPLPVSTDYMYTCAVHRNDNMAILMSLNYDEITKYHGKTSCAEFRNFFNKATQEIVNTHVNFDEIANEVFVRTDALLKKEYQDIIVNRRHTKKNALIGMFKSALGFVPFLSWVISAFDFGVSGFKYASTLKNQPTVIEHIYFRNTTWNNKQGSK